MVRLQASGRAFPAARPQRPFYPEPEPSAAFPVQVVRIDWDRLLAKRPSVLETVDAMPAYLLKPEILGLLAAEIHPTYCLILDLMWTTGARISEVLALTPSSFIDDGFDYGVILKDPQAAPGPARQGRPAAQPPALPPSCRTGSRATSTPASAARTRGSSRWRARP